MSRSHPSRLLLSALLMAQSACATEVVEYEPDAAEVAATREPLYVKSTLLWPQDRPIPVCWENPGNDALERGWVRDAVARSWQAASNVSFMGWGACAANSRGIRIRIEDVAKAPHVKALGTGLDGMRDGMSLNFRFARWEPFCSLATQRESCIRSIAVHEFGHALGFAHEHNRPDTDRASCTEAPQGQYGDTLFGAWDLSSTMNYCNPVWNNNGALSVSDAAGVRALYGTRAIADFGYEKGTWTASKHPRMTADVDGDGRDDVVGFGDRGVIVSLARASGRFDPPAQFIADFGYLSGWRVEQHERTLADVDGDGRADIVAFGNEGVWVALSGGVRFYPPVFYPEFGYNQGWRVGQHIRTLADVNGDGRADIVGFGNDGVWLALALGGAQFGPARFVVADFAYNSGWRVANHVRMLADVNDDGRDDIVGFGTYGVLVSLSNGAGFGAPAWFTSEFSYNAGYRVGMHPRLLADVNLDGRADIVAFGNEGVRVALSGSTKFYPSQLVLADMGYNQGWRVEPHPRFVTDVSGDGRPDLVGFGDAGVYVATSLGGPLFGPMQLWAIRHGAADAVLANGSPLPARENVRGVADFDGDGAGDLFSFRANGLHTTDLTIHIK